VVARRERASLCCARVAPDASARGRSTSSLDPNGYGRLRRSAHCYVRRYSTSRHLTHRLGVGMSTADERAQSALCERHCASLHGDGFVESPVFLAVVFLTGLRRVPFACALVAGAGSGRGGPLDTRVGCSHHPGTTQCLGLTIAGAVARVDPVRLAEMSMFWLKCLRLAPRRPRAAQLHR
jgi:hypothetical protein